MPYYTLGTTGFIAVTDVVSITYSLMNSPVKNERYTLIAENIIFKDFFGMIANVLQVKKPFKEASPLLVEIAWRIDAVISRIFNRKRKFTQAAAVASIATNTYSNDKIKATLNFNFIDIKEYIKANF